MWDIAFAISEHRIGNANINYFCDFLTEERPLEDLCVYLKVRSMLLNARVGFATPLARGVDVGDFVTVDRALDVAKAALLIDQRLEGSHPIVRRCLQQVERMALHNRDLDDHVIAYGAHMMPGAQAAATPGRTGEVSQVFGTRCVLLCSRSFFQPLFMCRVWRSEGLCAPPVVEFPSGTEMYSAVFPLSVFVLPLFPHSTFYFPLLDYHRFVSLYFLA